MSKFTDWLDDLERDSRLPNEEDTADNASPFDRMWNNSRNYVYHGVYPTIDTRGVEPYKEPEKDFHPVDALIAGYGIAKQHAGGLLGYADWEEEGRNLREEYTHQYEHDSPNFYAQAMLQAIPELAGSTAVGVGIGTATAPIFGSVGGGVLGAVNGISRLRSIYGALQSAYKAKNAAGTVFRTLTPASASSFAAGETQAALEASSEAYEARAEYIRNAKANGTYQEGITEAEADEVYDAAFKGNFAVVSAFNIPQFNMLYGKSKPGLLGKIGRAALGANAEGFEEATQTYVNSEATGIPATARDYIDSYVIGAGLGTGIHGAGRLGRYAYRKATGQPSDEEIERLQQEAKEARARLSGQESDLYGQFRQDSTDYQEESARLAARYANAEAERSSGLRDWSRQITSGVMSDEVHDLIVREAQAAGVDPRLALAVAKSESEGNQDEISDAGAIGVMQLMPETAQALGVDPYDTAQNIHGGIQYLKQMLDRFNGDTRLATAAYNAGPNAVEKHGGVPPFAETQNYVDRIHGLLDGAPEHNGSGEQVRDSGYYGEGGAGEGKTWVRGNGASLDGAQPQLLDAIDVLAKKFYEDTGVQLVVTAGTNGDHPSNGSEHGHDAGWKVDIADAGANGVDINGDGALFTSNYEAQPYLQQFVEYGRRYGLGMNVEGLGTPNVHIDVALDGTQWDGNGDNAGGFNPRKGGQSVQSRADELYAERMKHAPQWQDYKTRQREGREEEPATAPEPPKPNLLSFPPDDDSDETKTVYDNFAKDRMDKALADEDVDSVMFFRDMFKGNEFQNTPENRAAIADRYGDDFTQFAQSFAEPQQSTATTQPAQATPTPKGQPTPSQSPKQTAGNKFLRNDPVIQAGRQFLDELNKNGSQGNTTALRLQAAISQGDAVEVENILKANNRPTVVQQQDTQAQPQQTQQSQQDPVQKNTTPDNVLTQQQGQQQTQQQEQPKAKAQPKTGEEKAIAALQKPIVKNTPIKSKKQKGNAILKLADVNGIEIPEADRKSLANGKAQTVNSWRDNLIAQGIIPIQQGNTRNTQAQQPATQETAPTVEERANQIVANATQKARENWDEIKRSSQSRGTAAKANRDIANNINDMDDTLFRDDEADERNVLREQSEALAEQERRAKQDKEERELRSRQLEERRNAEASAEQSRQSEQELAQRESLPKDIATALKPASTSANARRAQGEGIFNLINSQPFKDMYGTINLPRGLENPLRKGEQKAINTAQEILARRGVRPVEWSQNIETTNEAGETTERNEEQSTQPQQEQQPVRNENPVRTAEAPERQQQIDSDRELAVAAPSNNKPLLAAQGEAILNWIKTPQFIAQYGRVKFPSGLIDALRSGNRKAVEIAQRELATRGITLDRAESQQAQSTQQEATDTPRTGETPKPTEQVTQQQSERNTRDQELTDEEAERLWQEEETENREFSRELQESELLRQEMEADETEQNEQSKHNKRADDLEAVFGKDAEKLRRKRNRADATADKKQLESEMLDRRIDEDELREESREERATKLEDEQQAQSEHQTQTKPRATDGTEEKRKPKEEREREETYKLKNRYSDRRNSYLQKQSELSKKLKDAGKRSDQKAVDEAQQELIKLDADYRATLEAEKEFAKNRKSMQGNADTRIGNFVKDEGLTPQQKLLKKFSEKLGVPLQFFNNPDGNFHGAFSNGVLFLNVNSKKGFGGVFWHEAFHWLKANNPKLYQQLVKAAGITEADRQAFLKRTKRTDLMTAEAIDEEILADMMDDVAKRTGLMQSIAGKNRGVVQRVMQWLKDTLNSFIETFRNPTGGLKTAQAKALAAEFGRLADQIKDVNGEKMFRYNRRTGDVEIIGERETSSMTREQIDAAARSDNVKYSIDTSDNSNELWSTRAKNWARSIFGGKQPSKAQNQVIVDALSQLAKHKILFGYNAKNEPDYVVDSFQKVIRARHGYDFKTLLPVAGKQIAKNLGLADTDAMSNYVADWMMTGAINNTSAEAKAFAKAMRDNPGEAELLRSVRDSFDALSKMTPYERVANSIARVEKKNSKRGNLMEEWVDDLHPIKALEDKLVSKSEDPAIAKLIKDKLAPYLHTRIGKGKGALSDMMVGAKGMSAQELQDTRDVLQAQFPNVDFSEWNPLQAIVDHAGGDKEGLQVFAVAKLEKEMYEKMREVDKNGNPKYPGFVPSHSEADCDAIIKAGEKKFGKAQKELVHYANTLAAIQYTSGLITATQFHQMINSWENYIPTARVFDEDEPYSVDLKAADSTKQKKGSYRRIADPLAKLAANTEIFLRQAVNNDAKLRVVAMARCGGFGEVFAETPKGDTRGHTIHFREDGKIKYLVTPDESIVRALESIQTPADNTVVVQAIKTMGVVLRGALTMFNAEFAAGNPFRDMPDAFIHNKYGSRNPFVVVPMMVEAAVDGFAKSMGIRMQDKAFKEFLAHGSTQSGFTYEITGDSSSRVDDMSSRTPKWKKVWRKFVQVAEASENMTRYATYKTALDGITKEHGGTATEHDKDVAALQARSATVDFARAGRSMRSVNRYLLFSNAAVQGLSLWGEKFANALQGKKGARDELAGAVFKTIMAGILPAMLTGLFNYSDDDRRKRYGELHSWEKDNYWVLATDVGGYSLRIPKGMDVMLRMTSAMTEEFVSYLAEDKPAEWKRLGTLLRNGLPSLTTTIFTPLIETTANYSVFKDAQIVPYGEQDDPKYKQYGKNTTAFAKWLGKTIDQSPRMIDHLISGYGGSQASYFASGLSGVPLILRRFLFDPDKNPRVVQDYYQKLGEQDELLNNYKERRKDGEKGSLPEDYDAALHKRLKALQEPLREISSAEKQIMENEKLDDDQKEERIRKLEERRVALCERAFKKAR